MTQDEIIEMAKQADFLTNELKSYVISPYAFEDADLYKELEAFANLVAQHERERLTDAAMKAAEKAVDVAMALEREACIDIVAMFGGSIEIEAAIRSRGHS